MATKTKRQPKRPTGQIQVPDFPMLDVRALVIPDTVNERERTVEVTFSTGERTLRKPIFDEPFMEELSLDPSAVQLERFNSGAPVLDSHGQVTHRAGGSGLQDMLGVVVNGSATVDGTEGRCTIKLSQRAGVTDIWQDVVDGVIQKVSLGYLVHQFRDITEPDDPVRVLRAILWEPFELSLLPIPVDTGAGVRSHPQSSLCTIVGEGVEDMALSTSKKKKKKSSRKKARRSTRNLPVEGEGEEGAEETPEEVETEEVETGEGETVDEGAGEGGDHEGEGDHEEEEAGGEEEGAGEPEGEATRNLPVDDEGSKPRRKKKTRRKRSPAEAERYRVLEIQNTAATLGFDSDFELTERLINRGVSLPNARKQLIDAAAEFDEAEPMTRSNVSTTGDTDRAKFRAGLQNALEHRALAQDSEGKPVQLTDAGRELRGMTLLRMAEECLRVAGVPSIGSLSRMDLVTRALHHSSDFPAILANVATKMLRQAYENTQTTYRFIARQRNAPDFKQMSSVQLGTGSGLVELPEGAEIKHGTVSDSRELFSLLTYARRITLTRQAIVNDDTNAFDRLPAQLGRKAAELEQDIAWALITGNVVMGDGNALFDAAHNNTGTGALSVTSLSAMRATMRTQTDPDGQLISAIPRILFGPAALETEMQQLTSSISAEQAGNVNPFASGQFTTVFAEPRLDADSTDQWYAATDPGQLDVMQYGYLDGESGPRIETSEPFDRDGVQWRILHDFYAAMLEWRGIYRSSGV